MSQSLRSVLSLPDEKHTLLDNGRKHKVDMFANTNFYFKMKVAGLPSPIKFSIQPVAGQVMVGNKQSNTSKPVSLVVYYGNSYAMNEPKESGHHLKFSNPCSTLLLHSHPPGSEFFQYEWVYLGLSSQSGCELLIGAFAKDAQPKTRRYDPILVNHDSDSDNSKRKKGKDLK